MPKQMYTEAAPIVRAATQAKLDAGDVIGALLYACGAGYDVPEPARPCGEALTALREAGDLVRAAEYALKHGGRLDLERRAYAMWLGRRAWAAQASALELAATQKAEQEAAKRAEAIEQRTLEILATTEAEARAKRLTEARKRAEKDTTKPKEDT